MWRHTPRRRRAATIWGATLVVVLGTSATAAAQTTGSTTPTTPTTTPSAPLPPTTTPTTTPSAHAGVVTPTSACVAVDATTFVTAFVTASLPTPNACTDASGNEVIALAAPSGTIDLAGTPGTYTGSAPLILDGNGQTVDAHGTSRVFTSSATLTTIDDATLLDGNDGGSKGGLVRTANALVVNNSTFDDSVSFDGGGAIDVESGNVTITDSTFEDNLAFFDPSKGVLAQGGALDSHRKASASSPVPVVTIVGSTFDGNEALANDGGAIYSDGNVVVVNSTITANTAGAHGGAITAANITLAYSTVTANNAGNGNDLGIRFLHGTPNQPGTLQTFGSVVTSAAPSCSYEFLPTGTSSGFNYFSDTSCYPGFSANPAPTDVVTSVDPQLGGLAANGGATRTLLPATTSPLVDAIPLTACQTAPLAVGVTTDQRGLPRPSGPGCDIGAVEVQVPVPPTPAFSTVARFTG